MNLPDAIVLGARKAGTSSLYDYLFREPSVFVPSEKELGFFAVCDFTPEQIGWPSFKYTASDYETCFKDASPKQLKIEISSLYLHNKKALQNLADYGYTGKLIVIVREPVERICSEFRYLRGNLKETMPNIREAVLAAEHRFHSDIDYVKNLELNYIENSLYDSQLQTVRQSLPNCPLHIVQFESLVTSASDELYRLYSFLEIPQTVNNQQLPHSNKSNYPRFVHVNRLIRKLRSNSLIRTSIRTMLPRRGREFLVSNLTRLNSRDFVISDEDKQWLAAQLNLKNTVYP